MGHVRNIAHFQKYREEGVTVREAAEKINEDTRRSIEASPHRIPVLQNGEALHGANWGNATCFPCCTSMASMFDAEMIYRIGSVVAEELRAVGVRQVFAPVVNLVRDSRWGRTEETYGEDVCLVSRSGAAYCRALEDHGVIATPKHFVDNYGDGGRDSNTPHSSPRTLQEVYLEPFRACFQEGHARSVMAAYNSLDGVPCSCNRKLLTELLREVWGFDGIVVSDYGGVNGVCDTFEIARDWTEAEAMCLKAGMDVDEPNGNRNLKEALERGLITEADIDRAVKRVLKCKFQLGLFEEPFVDPDKAQQLVRCEAHRKLALEAAEKGMVLLKNDGLLPLKKEKLRRIGLFGPSVNQVNVGSYSGGFYDHWWADDARTPYDALRDYLGEDVELVICEGDKGVRELAETCDLALYFAATLEGEGSDRCSLKLPDRMKSVQNSTGNTIILEEMERKVRVSQSRILQQLQESRARTCVVLINGAPVEVAGWEPGVSAILEAWYPGEQGSEAIVRTLFGDNNPGGKLPICFPLTIGQLPLYYSHKPSGRADGYIENDGKPFYGFGYGLSYTSFALRDFHVDLSDLEHHSVKAQVTVQNTGDRAGDEVVQLYIRGSHCGVVRPVKELKDYKRVSLQPGESKIVELTLSERDLSFWDADMHFGPHASDYDLMLGTGADQIVFREHFKI